jgi:hypothetical protein
MLMEAKSIPCLYDLDDRFGRWRKTLLNCTCFSRIVWGSISGTKRPDARPHEVTMHVPVSAHPLRGSPVVLQTC